MYNSALDITGRKFQLSQINLKNLCPFNPLRFAVECWNQREIQHSNASHNPRFIQSKPSLKNLLFEETKKRKTINQRLHIAFPTGNKFNAYQINHKGEERNLTLTYNCAVTPTKVSQVIEMPSPLHLPGRPDLSQVFEIAWYLSHTTAPPKPVIRE